MAWPASQPARSIDRARGAKKFFFNFFFKRRCKGLKKTADGRRQTAAYDQKFYETRNTKHETENRRRVPWQERTGSEGGAWIIERERERESERERVREPAFIHGSMDGIDTEWGICQILITACRRTDGRFFQLLTFNFGLSTLDFRL